MTLLKKGDFVIIGVVAAACVCSVALLISFSKQGSRVVIKQDNQIIYDKSINLNETVDTGTNLIFARRVTHIHNAVFYNHGICTRINRFV